MLNTLERRQQSHVLYIYAECACVLVCIAAKIVYKRFGHAFDEQLNYRMCAVMRELNSILRSEGFKYC